MAKTLFIASIVLSLLFGAVEVVREYIAMEEIAVNFAILESEKFAELHKASSTHETLAKDLKSFLSKRSRAPNGHLVAVEILTSSNQVLADVNEGSEASISAAERHGLGMRMTERKDTQRMQSRDSPTMMTDHTPNTTDNTNMSDHGVFWGDNVYVKINIPLSLKGDPQPLTFNGLFLVDPDIIDDMKKGALKTVAFTILIVLLTSLFLYPLVVYLDRNLRRRSLQLLEANAYILEALGSAIAKRDSDTGAHNYRVAFYAIKLGEAAGLSCMEITGLMKGAFLHDIGKIGVRDAILLKPGKLTPEEFTEMQTHVQHGLDIVCDVKWLTDAAEVIGGHHEKWNGTGYPLGLKKDQIPFFARIFAIADVFDALTSKRPYKDAFPLDQAKSILADGRGEHFDPVLLDLFLDQCDDLFNKIKNQDTKALKETIASYACYYLDTFEQT